MSSKVVFWEHAHGRADDLAEAPVQGRADPPADQVAERLELELGQDRAEHLGIAARDGVAATTGVLTACAALQAGLDGEIAAAAARV